jgi:hypothetical protein
MMSFPENNLCRESGFLAKTRFLKALLYPLDIHDAMRYNASYDAMRYKTDIII